MEKSKEIADVCIISEGSYPYITGGVSHWAHELITEQKERTFHVLTLMPPNPDLTFRYQFPRNVVGHNVYIVQDLPKGAAAIRAPSETWDVIKKAFKGMIGSTLFEDFEPLISFFRKYHDVLGSRILCESSEAWNFCIDLYQEIIPAGPFKDYFSMVQALSRSLFSLLLPELPRARIYHALCTGYAGFILHRARLETQAPCMVTEQGIYSNERRIEIAMAEWITDVGSINLALEDKSKSLKDFWLNAFLSLAHACFKSCDEVLSTFDGNQESQIEGGADPAKVRTIVHGIDFKEYASITRKKRDQNPVIAFIGRVVPIKDVKTFIRACGIVKSLLPDARFYALGPTEEDPDYFAECEALVFNLGLEDVFKFYGSVNLKEYFSRIDIVVLTSISEAQPRIIMEAGAVGIPSVATNVGACEQLCFGREEETPPLGQGGIITPLANPEATAYAIIKLLADDELYERCSAAIKKRIETYYRFGQEQEAYRALYQKYLKNVS